ncbi:hypothetical protein NZD89_17585 [Alicyclobacillus fastidiosus]|uniref:DUF2802 domain-containing protein n=1 Tax=Alicyclobacillus fastidiosus TaxID=392011 RepID=A0ABY6ZCC3_9BACL|nr:hypothetical protein [Alicyclobacillus fastidiosus]WAH40188.1 hypothetical protein NZD89_17585 [Alicyclobacillus fastidiosus]GMA61541.1 hypothetical protein GCM10025859_19810 [Alicyclobacillus fastidiosus]
MTTLILAIVCVILIFVLYVVSGGWKKYGGFLGLFKWLRAGAQLGPVQANPRVAHASGQSGPSSDEAIQVLKELYTEFDERTRALECRLEQLEQSVQALEVRVQSRPLDTVAPSAVDQAARLRAHSDALEQMPLPSAADIDERQPRPTPGEGVSPSDELYFVILDMLEAGSSDDDIARALSVPVSEVAYVRQIMSGPETKANGSTN